MRWKCMKRVTNGRGVGVVIIGRGRKGYGCCVEGIMICRGIVVVVLLEIHSCYLWLPVVVLLKDVGGLEAGKALYS